MYRGYVASFVKSRALDLTRAESAYHASRAAVREVEERQQSTARRQLELAETLFQLQREGDALEERIRTLRESDEFRAVRDLDEAVSRAQEAPYASSVADPLFNASYHTDGTSRARDSGQIGIGYIYTLWGGTGPDKGFRETY